MKKCPYCNAELQDNAQFCYYCMKLFGEREIIKKKTYKKNIFIILLPVAVMVLIVAILLVLKFSGVLKKTEKGQNYSGTSTLIQGQTDSEKTQTSQTVQNDQIYYENQKTYSSDSSKSSDVTPSAPSSYYNGVSQGAPQPESQNKPQSKPQSSSPSSSRPDGSSSQQPSSSQQTSSVPSSSVSTPSSQPQPTPEWEIRTVSGGVEITGIGKVNNDGVYNIPSKIDGKTVVGIGDSAFYYSNVKNVTIPSTVKYIDDKAFYGCNGLTSIMLPTSVKRIGLNAFTSCKKLSHIYIASNSVEIDNYAFSTSYQRDVELTIHAPSSVMDSMTAKLFWDANYKEWNG